MEPVKELEVLPVSMATDTPNGIIKPAELKQMLAIQTKNRKLIAEFVKDHLVDGVDFGKINLGGRMSKNVLFKPGQEKIFSLMQITDELVRDEETLSMFDNKIGLVAYLCTLYRNGQRIGSGRGAADITEKKGWTANSCIKIAEKRARMDACLSLGFSEYFTQDLEDTQIPEDKTEEAPQSHKWYPGTPEHPSGMREGQVEEREFTVEKKELHTSDKTGKTVAFLTTDIGRLTAFANTYPGIFEGSSYRANLEASRFNGKLGVSVMSIIEASL